MASDWNTFGVSRLSKTSHVLMLCSSDRISENHVPRGQSPSVDTIIRCRYPAKLETSFTDMHGLHLTIFLAVTEMGAN